MEFALTIAAESWQLLLEAGVYVLLGILIGGLLNAFLSPAAVARHLGKGRFLPVFKAALFGVPMPLCSCGVLPAAAALKKQGANNGATVAFLVATPESGVDSIGISYALLDPIMTVARPLAAFATALVAGSAENLRRVPDTTLIPTPPTCGEEGCCNSSDRPPTDHLHHHTIGEKVRAGLRYAFADLWADIAPWFFLGLLLAGIITALVPDDLIQSYLGGGLTAMLFMLLFGIPLYICASASTPIAAALILKGVSPGAALVFLLVGPATNMASLTVLGSLIGKRATILYLTSIATTSVLWGLLLDALYATLGISAQANMGQAVELLPHTVQLIGAVTVLLLSVKPVGQLLGNWLRRFTSSSGSSDGPSAGCGCSGGCQPPTTKGFPTTPPR
ncbi:MAG: SO_0444 family Cu/Zn efflux transporter [Thermodesulfobacteriota bacterium]